jgi:hypothetical protein
MSLWRYDGFPAGGNAPGATAIPTNSTTGALPFTDPGGGRASWLTQFWATGLVSGTLILYDRLLHQGNLSGSSTADQTVGDTITRNTGGAGNIVFVEIYSVIGGTAREVTMSYTNQSGTSGQTSVATKIGATGWRENNRVILLPLQSGDTGVQAVASLTLSASTGGTGAMGITIGNPLAYVGIGTAGGAGWRDFVTGLPGIPSIQSGSCLSLMFFPTSTAPPEITGGYSIVES